MSAIIAGTTRVCRPKCQPLLAVGLDAQGGTRRRKRNSDLAFAVETVEPMLRLLVDYMSRPSDLLEWLAIPPGRTRRG